MNCPQTEIKEGVVRRACGGNQTDSQNKRREGEPKIGPVGGPSGKKANYGTYVEVKKNTRGQKGKGNF